MQKNKIPGLITILMMTLITAVMWVGFGVYRAIKNKPAPTVPQQILQALTPILDNNVAGKMQGRVYINEESISEPTIMPTSTANALPTPQITASPTPVASSSATPTASASASPTPTGP